jgi:uncharacterized membrane-anchored protein
MLDPPMTWKEGLHYAAAVAAIIGAFVRNPWRVAGFWMLWGAALGLSATIGGILTERLRAGSIAERIVGTALLLLSGVAPTLLMMVFGMEFPE